MCPQDNKTERWTVTPSSLAGAVLAQAADLGHPFPGDDEALSRCLLCIIHRSVATRVYRDLASRKAHMLVSVVP